jgi:two-component system, OmpR family, sensor histidine kinase BaeS
MLANLRTMPRRVALTTACVALAFGVVGRLGFHRGGATLGCTLAIVVGAAALAWRGNVRRRGPLAALALGVVLAAFSTIRTFVGCAVYANSGSAWQPVHVILGRLRRGFGAVLGSPRALAEVIVSVLPEQDASKGRAKERFSLLLRSIALGGPLLLLAGSLLAQSDRVFASYFKVRFPSINWAGDAVAVALLAVAALGLLRLANSVTPNTPATTRGLPAKEVATVLSGFVVLFGLFTLSQIVAAVGGNEYVQRRTGGELDYTQYARSGFFQLLGATAITLTVVLSARGALRRATGRLSTLLRWLNVVLCLFNVAVVGSSIRRIQIYSNALGFTMLRLYSTVFAIWIAIVFLLVAVAAVRIGAREWVGAAVFATALVGVLAMNVVNPEAIVARHNMTRALRLGTLDTRYLDQFSPDGLLEVATQLPRFTGTDANSAMHAELLGVLCSHNLSSSDGGLSYNRAHRSARRALAELCSSRNGR